MLKFEFIVFECPDFDQVVESPWNYALAWQFELIVVSLVFGIVNWKHERFWSWAPRNTAHASIMRLKLKAFPGIVASAVNYHNLAVCASSCKSEAVLPRRPGNWVHRSLGLKRIHAVPFGYLNFFPDVDHFVISTARNDAFKLGMGPSNLPDWSWVGSNFGSRLLDCLAWSIDLTNTYLAYSDYTSMLVPFESQEASLVP